MYSVHLSLIDGERKPRCSTLFQFLVVGKVDVSKIVSRLVGFQHYNFSQPNMFFGSSTNLNKFKFHIEFQDCKTTTTSHKKSQKYIVKLH